MKKLTFLFLSVAFALAVNAQSDKYKAAMKDQIGKLETAFQNNDFPQLANSFERIGDAEKTQWLPYYYAAYANVMSAYLSPDKSKVDAIADKADAMITKAETLNGKPNSEIFVVKSMVASARMQVDPQNRWMQYGKISGENIEKAKVADPTNPRPVYLEGQAKFYTPEQFGGGKSVAKPYFEKALSMFDTFKPAGDLEPAWGKASTQYFLDQCK
ncbi:hypothetical protein [Flavihumibacter petaseus]|uniref:Uncharacterized protein n=1 Tax=Flavihumibacter petaseus NBRC 106054 TaxID=1220578 RepID=A0A0E9N5W0_9BACT|nr:hypothetical protein [Flavihumibacter petaseus]GAO45076.1 hypothetical protein FPE01S_04_03190 [Flavihumibacter petaseus NBRC 106054]